MIALFTGTRPEVIKMAPIARVLGEKAVLVGIDQQQNLLKAHLEATGLPYRTEPVPESDCLPHLASNLLAAATEALSTFDKNTLVLVQGDTQTALAAAQAAFLAGIPIGHVEAGLRTNSKNPFPEEMNRRLISQMTTLHFCPTVLALYNLRRECLANDWTFVTGNTSIDALFAVPDVLFPFAGELLVTCHRREGWETYFPMLVQALRRSSRTHIWPLHPNPQLKKLVEALLPRQLHTIPPTGHAETIHLMKQAKLIVTDSGGIVEEATALGKRVLVLREETERPEAVRAGAARMISLAEMPRLHEIIEEELAREHKPLAKDVFGDGKAGERIAKHCLDYLEKRK